MADALVERYPMHFGSSESMAHKFMMALVTGSTGFVRQYRDGYQINYKAIAEKTGVEFIPGEWKVREN